MADLTLACTTPAPTGTALQHHRPRRRAHDDPTSRTRHKRVISAWWLNLQAHPDATVDLVKGSRAVRARAAEGEERSRLWARWRGMDRQLDAYATLRSSETAVVILEPQSVPS